MDSRTTLSIAPTPPQYVRTLQELHATEQGLLDALGDWRRAAGDAARDLLTQQMHHTRQQAMRLAALLADVGAPLDAASGHTIRDLLEEGRLILQSTPHGLNRDLALLAVLRRVALFQLELYAAAWRGVDAAPVAAPPHTLREALVAEQRAVRRLLGRPEVHA